MCSERRPQACRGLSLRDSMRLPSNGSCFRPRQPKASSHPWPPTGPRCTTSSNGRVSPCSCCGRNTRPPHRRASSTAGSARRIEPGPASSTWSCARAIALGRSSLSIMPARAARPRDKAKVEVGVQVVERWILARLRHQTFFALAEVNAAVRALLPDLNARPFKKLPGSRDSLFAALDRPALRPLPAHPYEYAEWKRVRVNIDDHVEVEGHYYSVPY